MPVYRTRQASEPYGYPVGVLIEGMHPGRGAAGEMGNPASFPMPVLYSRLPTPPGATADARTAAAVAAARQLEAQGVGAIVGSGRSLLLSQDAVRGAVGIPVCLSPIAVLPMIALTLRRTRPVTVLQYRSDSALEPEITAFGAGTGIRLTFCRIALPPRSSLRSRRISAAMRPARGRSYAIFRNWGRISTGFRS